MSFILKNIIEFIKKIKFVRNSEFIRSMIRNSEYLKRRIDTYENLTSSKLSFNNFVESKYETNFINVLDIGCYGEIPKHFTLLKNFNFYGIDIDKVEIQRQKNIIIKKTLIFLILK